MKNISKSTKGKSEIFYINSLIILLVGSIIAISFLTINRKINNIEIEVKNTISELENNIKSGINSVLYLKTVIDERFKIQEEISLKYAPMVHKTDDKGHYALDIKSMANLVGYKGLNVTKKVQLEMEISLSLTPYMKLITQQNKTYSWIYYKSKNNFSTIYPYLDSTKFKLSDAGMKAPLWQKALPKNNPNGDFFFTPLYFDTMGLGLMVTLGHPIYFNDEFLGTLDFDITLKNQRELLDKVNLYEGSYFVTNKEGQIIASSGIDGFNNKKIFLAQELIDDKILSANIEDSKLIASDNHYIYTQQLENTTWKIYYYKDKIDIYLTTLYYNLALLLIIIILFKVRNLFKKLAIEKLKVIELNNSLEEKVIKEVEKNRQKEKMMLQQSRLAQMGEMISMIAHQWRQPLNILAMLSQTIILKYHRDKLNDKAIEYFKKNSNKQIQNMSQTINDFRDFFKPEKERVEFILNDIIKNTIDMVMPVFIEKQIDIIFDINNKFMILGFPNELSQTILNIVNNAKDALIENEIKDKQIIISLKMDSENIILTISDNAGGIPLNIIDKIFDPYFSTKEEKNGTGLGLYMSKIIIEEHMGGKVTVSNQDKGAVFLISLPTCEIREKST